MIRIDQPCPEKWENMIPSSSGNYCDKCCKVVVDFSEKSNEEIVNYFTVNAGKKICGRFLNEQVERPKIKFRLSRFLAALVLVFGGMLFVSCNRNERSGHLTGDSICIDSSYSAKMRADSIRIADSIAGEDWGRIFDSIDHK
jgi:hypothetical protein